MAIPVFILSLWNWMVILEYYSFLIFFILAYVGQFLGTFALSIAIPTINYTKQAWRNPLLWLFIFFFIAITAIIYMFVILIALFMVDWKTLTTSAVAGTITGIFGNIILDFLSDYIDFITSIRKYIEA